MSRIRYTAGMQLQAHTLTAHNDAAASANKIHDDTVAQQYGFAAASCLACRSMPT